MSAATTPITSTFFESAAQMQDAATQRLHRAMRGVDGAGGSISVARQMEEINRAQAELSATQAALNALKKLLDALGRSA